MRTDLVPVTGKRIWPAGMLRPASDQCLVAHVRAGSERAFEALFDRHHRAIVAFCRHMLGSTEEAEDAAQLTFLAAYRELVRAEPPFALRPWLYAIARHRCLSALRARRERPVEAVPEPATDHLAAETAAREDLRMILADVARLPDDQRAALILAELGDVRHEDIARILDCPRAKVKALIFQARSSLTASRTARETPCAEIRAQLATLRGGALRRATLRRHLHECPSCRAFRKQLRSQRRALGLLLPLFGSGGGAGGTALTAGALSTGGLAAIGLVAIAIHAGTTPPTTAAPQSGRASPRVSAPRHTEQARITVRRDDLRSVVRARAIPPARGRRPPATTERKTTGPAARPPSADHAEPSRQPRPATPSEAPRAREPIAPVAPVEPAGSAKARTPPRANGHPTPAKPAKPVKPAKPAKPQHANGRSTPPQATSQGTSAEHGRGAEKAPAAGKAGPEPIATPPPLPAVAAAPGKPAEHGGGNDREPAGDRAPGGQ
jgi:RNA polymerase sigma factor (sigma-70 family)